MGSPARPSQAPLQGGVKIDIPHNGSVVGHVVNAKLKGGSGAGAARKELSSRERIPSA